MNSANTHSSILIGLIIALFIKGMIPLGFMPGELSKGDQIIKVCPAHFGVQDFGAQNTEIDDHEKTTLFPQCDFSTLISLFLCQKRVKKPATNPFQSFYLSTYRSIRLPTLHFFLSAIVRAPPESLT